MNSSVLRLRGIAALAAALALCAMPAAGLDFSISLAGAVLWDTLELRSEARLNLPSAGLKLPTGRSQAEEIVEMEFPRLIRGRILSLQVDSSSTLADLVDRGDLPQSEVDAAVEAASRSAPRLSADLENLSAAYTVDLTRIVAKLVRHRTSQGIQKPLIPQATRPYTGIVVIADQNLPVHGRNRVATTVPCLFPKIWDSDMNLFYERNLVDSSTARERGIVRYAPASRILLDSPSGIAPELRQLVGDRPIRILARGLFGVAATDPIIDRSDAMAILSSEENRRLLTEGRVVIILPQNSLSSTF